MNKRYKEERKYYQKVLFHLSIVNNKKGIRISSMWLVGLSIISFYMNWLNFNKQEKKIEDAPKIDRFVTFNLKLEHLNKYKLKGK